MSNTGLRRHWIEIYAKLVVRAVLAASTRAPRLSTTPLRVLMYHKVNAIEANPLSVSPANFETHLQVISESKWTPVSLRQVESWASGVGDLPAHPLLLTFDDGYRDNCTNAAPLLERYQIPACCFLTVGVIDTRGFLPHDLRYGVAREKAELLSWSEVRELESRGW